MSCLCRMDRCYNTLTDFICHFLKRQFIHSVLLSVISSIIIQLYQYATFLNSMQYLNCFFFIFIIIPQILLYNPPEILQFQHLSEDDESFVPILYRELLLCRRLPERILSHGLDFLHLPQ